MKFVFVSEQSALLSSLETCYDVPIAFALVQEPQSFLEATTHPGWQAAMDMKMQSIYDNHTWELVSLPLGCPRNMTKWVYKVKKDQARNITKLMA